MAPRRKGVRNLFLLGFFNCGYATSVTNCDVSDDLPPETVRESGAHIDIDQWDDLQDRYTDRIVLHLEDER